MLYFKNTELAEIHHVTLRTVLNWIQAAKDGKLDLTLHDENGKLYVANTARNIATITRMVEERRKYRNLKVAKTVTPRPEFYELYSEDQIYDIISNLEIHREIPRQYNYFNGGADDWDAYAARLAAEETPNVLNSTIKLLEMNQGYIDGLLAPFKRVNIIDIGVGNACPVKGLLAHLSGQDKLGRYIALDISPAMLKIAENNIQQWFGGKVAFEGYACDINYDRFSHLLLQEYVKENAEETVNLVLLLGGTLSNMRYHDAGYRIIHESMGMNDLLLHTNKLDTEYTRRYFDFNTQPGETRLPPIHKYVIDLLNIDPSFYEVELGYEPQSNQRFERVKLKVSLTIEFDFRSGKRAVKFQKGDSILVWRAHQQTADGVRRQLDKNDFYPLHVSQTEDQEYVLTISRVKRD